ncbi:MAG: Aspartate/tyrosine/aromatic aminotransferase [Rhodobacteraceae bacterium HLUCCA12]|nr:MAG: Aspartate/tyrosine/aromatic aminotransferase [Rhodobacteraceae bacterium HLUCCA12]
MPLPLNPALAATSAPPVMVARRWLAETPLPEGVALLNLSQAAPIDPPPQALRTALAQSIADNPAIHLYGPVLGLPELRAALARRMSTIYGGTVLPDQVAITAGCNQAFCASIAALAAPGDEVILPKPWYFNQRMWLRMQGIKVVPLACGPDLLPDPDNCAALITSRSRAIVLVTPNNPGGVEYPPDLLRRFADLAARHGLALVLDETYRDFHTGDGAPHSLFTDPGWESVLIHLYSFSKAYRLTGHRTGAIAAAPRHLAEVEKFLDTVAICPPGPGQVAALWGLNHLDDWLAGERAEILRRRQAMLDGFAVLTDWQVMGCGAYFAYVRHPFDAAAPDVARRLLREAGVLMLPGTMFRPEGDGAGTGEMRIAFANADTDQIATLMHRLSALR